MAPVLTSFPLAWLSALVTFGHGRRLHHPQPSPHLGSPGPDQVCQSRFSAQGTGLAVSSQDAVAAASPPQAAVMLLQLPSSPPQPGQGPCSVPQGSSFISAPLQLQQGDKQSQNHIFVPKMIFICPSFVYTNCHDNKVLPEHHLLTAAKP